MSQFLAMRSPNGGNSNSNSGGEEEDRDSAAVNAAASALDAASGKRSLGAILNGLSASAKKRRKQSKPIRLGADAPEAAAAEGRREFVQDEPAEEGPEPGERGDGPLNLSGSSSKDEEEESSNRYTWTCVRKVRIRYIQTQPTRSSVCDLV